MVDVVVIYAFEGASGCARCDGCCGCRVLRNDEDGIYAEEIGRTKDGAEVTAIELE